MNSNATSEISNSYPSTALAVLNLAAPHTWAAAVVPVLLAVCLASLQGSFSAAVAVVLLMICVLMQSSVNTFNDYFDFAKGTDQQDADVAADDAVLVYGGLKPRTALIAAVTELLAAFALGLYPIYLIGPGPLMIALMGGLAVVLYSGGKTPISYLPIGEIISGTVMGGLIPLASYWILTGTLDFTVLLWSVPVIIGIGLIMLVNNGCDIERDIEANRKTLAVLLGREPLCRLFRSCLVVWIGSIIVLDAIFFRSALILVPFLILMAFPLVKQGFLSKFLPAQRQQSMALIISLNLVLGALYCLSILASGLWILLP